MYAMILCSPSPGTCAKTTIKGGGGHVSLLGFSDVGGCHNRELLMDPRVLTNAEFF